MKKQIKIFDTTLRDGEQSPGAAMSVDQKIEMAVMLERLGVDRIEAGFPVSSPVQFEAVKQIATILGDTATVGLARMVRQDVDAAYQALKNANCPMLHTFIATSPLHREFKLKKTKDDVLCTIREMMCYATRFFQQIEFSAEDATRTEPDFLVQVIRTAIECGATSINVPDTVGYMIPNQYGELIHDLKRSIPELEHVDLSVHCHNDLGLAVANSLNAVTQGATQIEVTLNGIGERAGNCSLEEVVMAMTVRGDVLPFQTGIRTELLYPASRLLQNITGLVMPRNKPILGDNAFAHESGIHQDGVIKHRETYEIMNPVQIGRPTETLVLGRHSGKHSLKERLSQYAIDLSETHFEQVFSQFTALADKKKEISDEDVIYIVSEILGRIPTGFGLECFQVSTGNKLLPTATVKITKDGESLISSSTGDGPVDALFRAIEDATRIPTCLQEYIIQAVGGGQDAQGQVRLILEIEGQGYVGRGSSTDIVEASALAYLNALNRYYLKLAMVEHSAHERVTCAHGGVS